MKFDVKKAVANAGEQLKLVKEKQNEKLTELFDKNGDGTIDREDFGLGDERLLEAKEAAAQRAADAGKAIKRGQREAQKAIDNAKFEMDLKTLRPVFSINCNQPSLANEISPVTQAPKMVAIVDRDKKREESAACRDSIGYWTTVKGTDVLNIYEDCARSIGFRFLPDVAQTIYYIDPCIHTTYVSLDAYFKHMKEVRVAELEQIAYSLGAKNIKIEYKEQKKSIVNNKAKGNAKVLKCKAEAAHEHDLREYSSTEILLETSFSGNTTPITTETMYFKHNQDINALIEMRTGDTPNRITKKSYSIDCIHSSGIKAQDAMKIDAVLQGLKCNGTASFTSAFEQESRTTFEYTIEF